MSALGARSSGQHWVILNVAAIIFAAAGFLAGTTRLGMVLALGVTSTVAESDRGQ